MKNSPYSLIFHSPVKSLFKRSGRVIVLSLFTMAIALGVVMEGAIARIRFNAPPVSAPGNREAGTSRMNMCTAASEPPFTAIIPESNIGLTADAFPTFFAYVPANHAKWAEFYLYDDESREELYAARLSLPVAESESATNEPYQSSVLQFSIPEEAHSAALEPGKDYLWALMLVCDAEERTRDMVITGTVRRVDTAYLNALSPPVREQLALTSDDENADENALFVQAKLSAYGEAGLWHELLKTLAPLSTNVMTAEAGNSASNSIAYQNDWSDLLSQQGLEALANYPIFNSEVNPL